MYANSEGAIASHAHTAKVPRSQRRLDRGRNRALGIREEQERRNDLRGELGTKIREHFPGIPKERLRALIDFYTNPSYKSPHSDEPGLYDGWRKKVRNLTKAWVRHHMTDYDQILASTGIGGAQNKKMARHAVSHQLASIINSWRKT